MNQCLPVNAKMSKAKKVLDEARETQNRELDLVDKGLVSFEELPGLCKYPAQSVQQVFVKINTFKSKNPREML